jgi:hypothetical protein
MYIEQATAPPEATTTSRVWRDWIMVAIGLVALVGVLATIVSAFALARSGGERAVRVAAAPAPAAEKAAPTPADAKAVAFEKFEPVDATLPAIPPGPVKKFKVDVYQHVTQVAADLARPRSGASPSTASSTAAPASRSRWWSPRETPSTSRSSTAPPSR